LTLSSSIDTIEYGPNAGLAGLLGDKERMDAKPLGKLA